METIPRDLVKGRRYMNIVGMVCVVLLTIPICIYIYKSPVDGYRLIIDGTYLGYIEEPTEVFSFIDILKADYSNRYGGSVYLRNDVRLEKTVVPVKFILSSEDLERILRDNVEFGRRIYSITIKGRDVAFVKDRHIAIELLENFKKKVLKENGVDPLDVFHIGFYEDVVVKAYDSVDNHVNSIQEAMYILNALNKSGELSVGWTERVYFDEIIKRKDKIIYDSTLEKDKTKVISEGQDGIWEIYAQIRRKDGVEIGRTIIDKKVLREAEDRVVAVGTKERHTQTIASRGSSGMFIFPTRGTITSGFGTRWGRQHNGVDIANKMGTAVFAARNGKVEFCGWRGGYGNLIILSHQNGFRTYYAHLSSISVSKGQTVKVGEVIGKMGSTGNSTGSHLHFEVRKGNVPQNPMRYLR